MPRFTLLAGLVLVACQGGRSRPSPKDLVSPNPMPDRPDATVIDTRSDAGCGEGPAGDFCGQVFLREEVTDPPNVYFVVDRSGSMGAPFEGSVFSKYQTARGAIADLLRSIGHRVRYGAAVFPSRLTPNECGGGEQIFPTTLGDPAACAAQNRAGPLLADLSARLASIPPDGATPTAATMEALRPTLTALEGNTFVVLLTDGAPNCNFEVSCNAADCTLNIEGARFGALECDEAFNCCDPANTGEGTNGYCADGAATENAIAALAGEGILTYVVGMPGAEPYAALLNRLAAVGGTSRGADTDYFAVGDADALREALYDIGTAIAIQCAIDLEEPPEDPARVNVYFDGELVPADAADGWAWDGDARIEVRGAACDELSSGEVLEARVVFGCDTVVR